MVGGFVQNQKLIFLMGQNRNNQLNPLPLRDLFYQGIGMFPAKQKLTQNLASRSLVGTAGLEHQILDHGFVVVQQVVLLVKVANLHVVPLLDRAGVGG